MESFQMTAESDPPCLGLGMSLVGWESPPLRTPTAGFPTQQVRRLGPVYPTPFHPSQDQCLPDRTVPGRDPRPPLQAVLHTAPRATALLHLTAPPDPTPPSQHLFRRPCKPPGGPALWGENGPGPGGGPAGLAAASTAPSPAPRPPEGVSPGWAAGAPGCSTPASAVAGGPQRPHRRASPPPALAEHCRDLPCVCRRGRGLQAGGGARLTPGPATRRAVSALRAAAPTPPRPDSDAWPTKIPGLASPLPDCSGNPAGQSHCQGRLQGRVTGPC
ncbi:transcription initiation factor TFIID subunit 4-like isoform X2 [Prionailurus viverrinus]|uniref:transcription initiation factor TFIID subunit 4-like isoform X2 n=1 Tax=Prionailurus viverrinus TaxID=61388 RepID=UPI001FF296FC|nr:transcription initiation factor TFIID subunit 4-like isoform X2 [Prionailurus viverrinus]